MIILQRITGGIDPEFDESPDMLELIEGVQHGHLNMAITECPTYTVWSNPYRNNEAYRNLAKFEPLPLDLSLNNITSHIAESLSKLPNRSIDITRPRKQYEPPPRSKLRLKTPEEILVELRDSATIYDKWLEYNAQLEVLRSETR